jgi:hypothetical protein
MANKLTLGGVILLLLVLPVISAGAADQGVSNLRGQWILNWTLDDGFQPLPLYLLINDVQPGDAPGTFKAAGCMRSPYSGAILPAAIYASYESALRTYEWSIYSTFVPSAEVGEPPYLIRFDGQASMNGEGVSDDTAQGTFTSNSYQGTWTGRHHDRRFFNCPPVDLGDEPLHLDVYAYQDLGGFEGQQMILEGFGIRIVSSAMQVTDPNGTVFIVPFYTDIFSPGADFISEFRFLGNYPGLPIPGAPYYFVLLDVLGRPIPGTEGRDTWTHCSDDAPTDLAVTANPVSGGDVTLTWSGVPLVSGEFDPPRYGFYQIGLSPISGPGGNYGAAGIIDPQHVLPWSPFAPGTPGTPDGFDMGDSLSQLNDNTYALAVFAFSAPPPDSFGTGHECFTADWRHTLTMVKSGDTLTFGSYPPQP